MQVPSQGEDVRNGIPEVKFGKRTRFDYHIP